MSPKIKASPASSLVAAENDKGNIFGMPSAALMVQASAAEVGKIIIKQKVVESYISTTFFICFSFYAF